MFFFVGTYTRMGGPGIAACALTGNELQLLDTAFIPNPTYVILSGNQKTLYAGSSDAVDGTEGGSIAAYQVDGSKLTLKSRHNTGSAGPCFQCLSADERFLYTANYHAGSLTVFPTTPDGLGERIQLIRHEGKGPHPTRQQGPHVHQVSFIPGTNLLCVVDLGLDALIMYAQDPATGLLTLAGRLDCTPGSGPRHIIYGQNGMIYLANELGNTVSVMKRVGDSAELVCLQTLPTLPDGWSGESTCAAIRIDEQYVYVSNRGHDSLAIFRFGPDGLLALAGIYKTGNGIPRDFILLGNGRILVAHQAGDISLLQWTPGQEMVRLSEPLPIGGAVCVCPVI
jgi:6-phosphogluconolactonase